MRFPLVPTVLVAAAVATMIALGFWQLRRADEKAALAARYARNSALPAIALPIGAPPDETLLYRRATAFCLEPTAWRLTGGKSASGRTGTRYIAECRTGAEGPGFAADMGVSPDPRANPGWRGGEVTGTIVAEPSRSSLMQRLRGRSAPPRPMLVSERPAPGLEASARPSADVTNNSLAYAFQWFFFAAAAAAIYVLALRKRQRAAPSSPADPSSAS
ncbi:MAG TPA: SURF1 family cytochrome oxidase biogenesis protein [Allosphingosinicella sp.]|jgi:cytochrome oxidase assembly protein ShyY1|nr:SURF1 family cytochrome oxidase biogenesis protein [Allosphingosinicella sp.]